MAKATQAEAQITRQSIIDAALDIVVNQGADKVTLGNLAKAIGKTRGSVSCHFKKKEDIFREIEPMLSKLLRSSLDFTSAAAFKESWIKGIDGNPHFVAAATSFGYIMSVNEGVKNLQSMINDDDDVCFDTLMWCIGYANFNLG
ncbi:TetR family transcriptional regulator [Vibrio rotiferianus]|uniref:TetR family transcriptional regulator n=1 Tax=Vibrio rotiferianus TaxID=190895 RepID=UPI0028957090|nr:HTH tetR-type domain-containing protein [Vibrio rotiferianus]